MLRQPQFARRGGATPIWEKYYSSRPGWPLRLLRAGRRFMRGYRQGYNDWASGAWDPQLRGQSEGPQWVDAVVGRPRETNDRFRASQAKLGTSRMGAKLSCGAGPRSVEGGHGALSSGIVSRPFGCLQADAGMDFSRGLKAGTRSFGSCRWTLAPSTPRAASLGTCFAGERGGSASGGPTLGQPFPWRRRLRRKWGQSLFRTPCDTSRRSVEK